MFFGANNESPAWSPDNKKIAFVNPHVMEMIEIYVMNTDGSNQVNLTNSPEDDYFGLSGPQTVKRLPLYPDEMVMKKSIP